MSRPILKAYLSPEAQEIGVLFEAPKHGDAGFDVRSIEKVEIPPHGQVALSTGLFLAIPEGYVGLIRDRSSMASKRLYTHGGVIDAGYRGEVRILLENGNDAPVQILAKDKVAQLLLVKIEDGLEVVSTVEELGSTVRGEKGFGSSGR